MSAIQQDMTVGKPGTIILNFTLPIFIGNVFQQFYSMADTIIVGKFVGTDALAAVGSTGTIMFLIFGFIMGMTAGLSVITAQKFGAGDMDALKKSVGSSLWLSGGMTLLLTAVFMFGMKWLLEFMHTPKDIFADAYTYIMIICAGIVAQMLYNLLASLLRAIGNSKVPLYFLILSALLNILLDLVFIIAFHMGVSGAAWATVISQGISGLICFYYIVKKVPILHVSREDVRPDKFLIYTQIRIGLPMALQYSITAIGAMMVQVALNLLGSGAVADFTAANKIEQIVTQAYLLRPEHRGGENRQNPPGIPLHLHYGVRLLCCGGDFYHCGGALFHLPFYFRKCDGNYGSGAYLSGMRATVLYSPYGGKRV